MKLKTLIATSAAVVGLSAVTAPAMAGEDLDAIMERGTLLCGVGNAAGFALPDSEGNYSGLDVDYCRALAVALFGDADAVEFTQLTSQQRFTALQAGEVDLLSRVTTHTLTRDTSLGLNFAPVMFYDGQGFMVPRDLGITNALELDGATVCVSPGTTTELNLADYFRANGMEYEPVVIEGLTEAEEAFYSGRCDVYTTDSGSLAGSKVTQPTPEDYVILPEIISKEPLAPTVRHGDDEFYDIVKWTVYALVQTEELGISSENVDEFLESTNPEIQRLLGVTAGMGEALGVSEDWVVEILRQVGNYGEIFAANVGSDSPLDLERGLNGLWTQGGLMYSPPFR